jgi:hypothetical protein
MRAHEPREADARSLLGKLAAFCEGLEPGERAVLFDSLPKSPEEEMQGHYYSGPDVVGGRPGAPGGELGLEGGTDGKKYHIVVTHRSHQGQ